MKMQMVYVKYFLFLFLLFFTSKLIYLKQIKCFCDSKDPVQREDIWIYYLCIVFPKKLNIKNCTLNVLDVVPKTVEF